MNALGDLGQTEDKRASLPPPAIAFERPGKTISEEFTSANDLKPDAEVPELQFNLGKFEIVTVEPSDAPIPGEFGFSNTAQVDKRSSRASRVQDLGQQITIQYAGPMIELGAEIEPYSLTLEDDGEAYPKWVPKLSPAIEGRWTWLDPQTLQFEAKEKFARATTYGVKTACGTRWRFTSKPPLIKFSSYYHDVGLLPTIGIECDLEVDWASQLSLLHFRDEEGKTIPLAWTKSDFNYSGWKSEFVPTESLQRDTKYRLSVKAGVVSKAGPNPTNRSYQFEFRTYGDLVLQKRDPSLRSYHFERSSEWEMNFDSSNRFDRELEQADKITVTPELDEQQVRIYNSSINIRGRSPGGIYKVSFSPDLSDHYGQKISGQTEFELHLRRKHALYFPRNQMVAIQAHRPAVFTFFSQTHRGLFIRVHRVEAEQWTDFLEFQHDRDRNEFSTLGQTGFIEFDYNPIPDQIDLELAPYLKGKTGHLVIQVRPVQPREWELIDDEVEATYEEISREWQFQSLSRQQESQCRDWQTCWVQISNLSPSHYSNFRTISKSLLVDGKSGKLVGAKSQLIDTELPKGSNRRSHSPASLFSHKSEKVLLPAHCSRVKKDRSLITYAFTDRELYRPGEEMVIKAWFWNQPWPGGPITSLPGETIEYSVSGVGGQILKGEVQTSKQSSAHLSLQLPSQLQLGQYSVFFGLIGERVTGHVRFNVQEFRRPRFEVTVQPDVQNALNYLIGAESFSGAPMSGASVEITASLRARNYRPPGWSRYRFGIHTDLWFRGHRTGQPEAEQKNQSQLDADGRLRIQLELNPKQEGRTYAVEVSAGVTDIDRQRQTVHHKQLVHPADVFLGIRLKKRVFAATEDIEVEYVVVDAQGNIIPEALLELRLKGEDSHYLTSSDRPQTIKLQTEKRGILELQGQVRDKDGRPHFIKIAIYRLGSPSIPTTELAFPALIDKAEYAVGEVGKVTFFAPHNGTAILRIVRGSEQFFQHRFVESGEHTMAFKITDVLRNEARLHLDFVGPDTHGEIKVYHSNIDFRVCCNDKTLEIELETSADKVGPGAEIEADITVRDPHGAPVANAEVALLAVDEAILFAGGYRIPEPFEKLYPPQQDATLVEHLWAQYKMPDFDGLLKLEEQRSRVLKACSMAGFGDSSDGAPALDVRKNFAPLAHFSPSLRTDGNGNVKVSFRMPDSLSKFRITAVALTADRSAGYGETQVQVSRPLLIEPSFPRFLSSDDDTHLAVTVRNLTVRALEVEVGMKAVGLKLREPKAKLVLMPPNSSREVAFRAEVQDTDQAIIRCVVRYGHVVDAVESKIPIYRAATMETVASCGELVDSALSFPIIWPERALPEFGGLSVEFATTALQGLEGAYRYILDYPFDCTEQIAAKIAATAALKGYLQAYQPEGVPSEEERDLLMERWISKLSKRYSPNGFRFWSCPHSDRLVYPSLFAHQAILLAHNHGYDTGGLERSKLRVSLARHSLGPGHLNTPRRTFFASYRLLLQHLAGESENLQDKIDPELATIDTWLFLLQCKPELRSAGLRYLRNSTTQTATTASVRKKGPYQVRYTFGSEQRTNAWALMALLNCDPEDPLIPKLVKGLQAHRLQGRWRNTQENIFAILALAGYFNEREAVEPNLRAGAWIGRRQIAGRCFRGREQTRHRWSVPPSFVRNANPSNVVVESKGDGRLYHRTELSWAVPCGELKGLSRGFEVTRSYAIVEGQGEVSDGHLTVQPGAKVRVTLVVKNIGPRYHVALVDPFPAGFEPLNPKLDTTEPTRVESRGWPYYQMRDHQLEAFATYLPSGQHRFSYEARATTQGRFQLRAAKVEEMYSPETFGRTAGGLVTVR